MDDEIKFLDTVQIFENIIELSSKAKSRVYAVVAFIGKNSYNLFSENIRNVGDIRFIINFSESSVKNGLTNPDGVIQLQKLGEVRNNENLHAKFYVFDDVALVCSANLSKHATTNIEAGVLIKRKEIVEEIVKFFEILWHKSSIINVDTLIRKQKAWNITGDNLIDKPVRDTSPTDKQKIKITPWKSPVSSNLQIKLKELLANRNREYFYIMHLSYNGDMKKELWDYAMNHNLIGISHIDVNDWRKQRELIVTHKLLSKTCIRQFDWLFNMKKGDIVLVLDGQYYLLGVAEVIDEECKLYEVPPEIAESINHGFFDHVREVLWIEKHEYNKRRKLPQRVYLKGTLAKVHPQCKKWWPTLSELTISINE